MLANVDWLEVARREAIAAAQEANPPAPEPIVAMVKVALGRASDEERRLVEDYFRQEEKRQQQLNQLQERLARCRSVAAVNKLMAQAQVEGWQLLPEKPALNVIEASKSIGE
ncbi:MAG: hypothetical protein NZL93_02220 [Chthoniobacterales bacterium]|nr:hypothetical protein [Chthoniobacterales bacterium]